MEIKTRKLTLNTGYCIFNCINLFVMQANQSQLQQLFLYSTILKKMILVVKFNLKSHVNNLSCKLDLVFHE